MKKVSTKLTSDRIATLGSRMMKFAPDIIASQKVYVIGLVLKNDGGTKKAVSVFLDSGLTVGDIRDAGASLVSQADGPEGLTAKKRRKNK